MVAPFPFSRSFAFDVTPDHLWETLARTERYPEWWPWLVGFDLPALAPGHTAACVVQAPLPYRLNVDVHLHEVEAGRLVRTEVTGDLLGPASLELAEDGAGTLATLSWTLRPQGRLLRTLARTMRPVLLWGHDRIVEQGLRQFVDRALVADQPATPPRA